MLNKIADAFLEAHSIREASYNHETHRYDVDWDDAVNQATDDKAINDLIFPMLVSGFCDFHEWAEEHKTDDLTADSQYRTEQIVTHI